MKLRIKTKAHKYFVKKLINFLIKLFSLKYLNQSASVCIYLWLTSLSVSATAQNGKAARWESAGKQGTRRSRDQRRSSFGWR